MFHLSRPPLFDSSNNLIIENLCALHPTTHIVNKENPAGAMKSGGFM